MSALRHVDDNPHSREALAYCMSRTDIGGCNYLFAGADRGGERAAGITMQ